MRKLRIKSYKRKSYIKDVKPGRGVKLRRIKGTRVRGFSRKDVGAPGRTPKSGRWFKPKGNLHGWSADMSASKRRSMAARARSDLSSARALQALANVSTDRKTRAAARQDALYFYRRHKG